MQDSSSSSKWIRVDFNLENLPSNPGLREKIPSYHPNNHDEIRRYYLQKGPCVIYACWETLWKKFLEPPLSRLCCSRWALNVLSLLFKELFKYRAMKTNRLLHVSCYIFWWICSQCQWRLWELFLGWSLINLNYTKFNKKTIWIYQHHRKNMQIHEILQFFVLTKRIRKKKDY